MWHWYPIPTFAVYRMPWGLSKGFGCSACAWGCWPGLQPPCGSTKQTMMNHDLKMVLSVIVQRRRNPVLGTRIATVPRTFREHTLKLRLVAGLKVSECFSVWEMVDCRSILESWFRQPRFFKHWFRKRWFRKPWFHGFRVGRGNRVPGIVVDESKWFREAGSHENYELVQSSIYIYLWSYLHLFTHLWKLFQMFQVAHAVHVTPPEAPRFLTKLRDSRGRTSKFKAGRQHEVLGWFPVVISGSCLWVCWNQNHSQTYSNYFFLRNMWATGPWYFWLISIRRVMVYKGILKVW